MIVAIELKVKNIIPLIKDVKDANDVHMEERKETLELRRKAEVEAYKEKAPFENYIED